MIATMRVGRCQSLMGVVVAALVSVAVAGCSGGGDGEAASLSVNAGIERKATNSGSSTLSWQQAGTPNTAPRLINHPENIQLGLAISDSQLTLVNPREHDPRALEEGKQLFISYNCADCHGDEGSGAMGPALDDGRWHFGGSAGEVYESIGEGRPDGMPAWGGRISQAEIWALVKYVRSLETGKNPTTENFEGATVERTGH
jgi:mono/diheme cytochrome c family protein